MPRMYYGYGAFIIAKEIKIARADVEIFGSQVRPWSRRRSVLRMKSPLDLKIQPSEVGKYGFPLDKKNRKVL